VYKNYVHKFVSCLIVIMPTLVGLLCAYQVKHFSYAALTVA